MAHQEMRRPAFPKDEFDQRLQLLRSELIKRELDAGIFFAPESIYYLCGYEYPTQFAFQLLVVPVDAEPFIVLRQVNSSGVSATAWVGECVTFPDMSDPIATTRDALVRHGLGSARVGLEECAAFLSVQTMRGLQASSSIRWGDCSGIVESLRLVKSNREIEYIRQAAAISDAGTEAARQATHFGASEAEIGAAIQERMMLAGGEYQASPLVLGIEERSRVAVPCNPSPNRKLGAGETMWIEVFGTIRRSSAGLKANCGAAPASKDLEKRWETAQNALARAVSVISPGKPASVIPEAVHETFRDSGYGETPHHQSGYSMGIAFAPNPHKARMLSLRQRNYPQGGYDPLPDR
jgi:Xaa-Pro dipeptidase